MHCLKIYDFKRYATQVYFCNSSVKADVEKYYFKLMLKIIDCLGCLSQCFYLRYATKVFN